MRKDEHKVAIDPKKIKVPYLDKSAIQQRVDRFCEKFRVDQNLVPLDVELLVEADLHILLRPEHGVKSKGGVEAFLFADRTTMMVDATAFDQNSPRLRFTIAHEIGHYVLHEDVYKHAIFKSITDWLNFFDELPEETHRRLEWQANEFAGRLLIPRPLLVKQFNEAKSKLKGTDWEDFDPLPQEVVEAMCQRISKYFGVSDYPVFIRLQDESIWRPN